MPDQHISKNMPDLHFKTISTRNDEFQFCPSIIYNSMSCKKQWERFQGVTEHLISRFFEGNSMLEQQIPLLAGNLKIARQLHHWMAIFNWTCIACHASDREQPLHVCKASSRGVVVVLSYTVDVILLYSCYSVDVILAAERCSYRVGLHACNVHADHMNH